MKSNRFIMMITAIFFIIDSSHAQTKLNESFLPKIRELKEVFRTSSEVFSEPIELDATGELLVFYSVVDYRPLLVEFAITLFRRKNGEYLLCSFYRHPYTKLARLSGWHILFVPDYDFSGKISEIGWKSFNSLPSSNDFSQFMLSSGHNLDSTNHLFPPDRFKFLATYCGGHEMTKQFGSKILKFSENETADPGSNNMKNDTRQKAKPR